MQPSWLSSTVWWSWLLVLWPCLWNPVSASKRLDSCSATSIFTVNGSANVNGTGPVNGEIKMPSVIYFQTSSRDPHDHVQMNYAWSTVGFPTLFLAQSFDSGSVNCTKNFKILNETEFLNSQAYGSLNIAGAGSNASLAIVFRRLIVFDGGGSAKAANGFNASATVAPQNGSRIYYSVYLNDSIEWFYSINGRYIVGKSKNFLSLTFKFQLPWMEEDRRVSYFPKTKYTLNSTVFDVTLSKFNYSSHNLKNGRIALEMIMVNGQQINGSSTRTRLTEDDEYTPSVFKTWEYYFGTPMHPYLQWKPISYQDKQRKSTKSQEAQIVFPNRKAIDFLNGQVPRSLASALFDDSTSLNGTAMYIVIGTAGDETYINTPYLTWTAVVGYGRVPQDSISIEVIIIITVALGIPALIIFLGSFYVTYKKKPWQNIARGIRRLRRVEGYERIN